MGKKVTAETESKTENLDIKENDTSKANTKVKKNESKKGKLYLSYTSRVVLCLLGFALLFALTFFFLTRTLKLEEEKSIMYQEIGNLVYKVYLKENEFYESTYLDKNMSYIASLIKDISVDMNYQFVIDDVSDMTFSYDVMANLTIYEDTGKTVLYEKEYVLKKGIEQNLTDKNIYNFKDNLSIDYDYYNALANRFKATYGVGASSELTVYVRVNKKINNETYNVNLNDSKQMALTIPLTQKTLDIKLNDTGINNSNSFVNESKTTVGNILFGILCLVAFVASVAALLKFLELIIILKPKASKYDKYIKKILNEYDRLIVETPSDLRLENKEIIKIKRFEELLDARDNLKRPIMYHNITTHQKCNFYIEKDNTVYLLTIKATDLEG